MNLSVVIISWNTEKMTLDCLGSLFRSLKKDGLAQKTEVIVIDNGSTDGSVAAIKKNFPQVRLKVNKTNLGFGRANNQGIKLAQGRSILLLNSDTLVQPGNIPLLLNYLKDHPKVGVVGPKLLNRDGTDQPSAGRFPDLWTVFLMLFVEKFLPTRRVRAAYSQEKETDWVMGAAMMCRAVVLKKVGGFDREIFMYMEELELCYRIKKEGHGVVYLPEAKITHLGRGSSKSGKKDPIINIFKGLVHFYSIHYSRLAMAGLRLMLKLKAGGAYIMGLVTKNDYLKETYGEAYQLG